jgi:hypothetical protein
VFQLVPGAKFSKTLIMAMKQKSLDLNTELDYACVVLPAHQK